MKITPKQEKTSYCVMSCIKRYLSHMNAPYTPMLLCNWSMGPIIEDEITLPYCMSPLDVLKAFSETDIRVITKEMADEKRIKYEIGNNRPIISYVDSFYCNWMTYYEKIQADHFVMIIDECKDIYYVLDPYLNETVNIVSKEVIHKDLRKENKGNHFIKSVNEKLFVFEKVGFYINDVSEIVKLAARKYKETYSEYMQGLRHFFLDFDNIHRLLCEDDIQHNKFYFDVKSIVDSREDFWKGLLYCESRFNSNVITENDVKSFKEILVLWRAFLSCLYRYKYSNSLQKKKMVIMRAQDYLKHIISLELFFAEAILSN